MAYSIHFLPRFPFHSLAVAVGLTTTAAIAPAQTTFDAVSISGRTVPTVGVAGWGDLPLAKSPFQASIVTRDQMRDRDVTRLADLTRLDAAISDAYNTEGYWDYLTVRGFVIDNRFNYRRDGLPINAETSIPLDNKERIEVLKGTSGLQAGTSAPGGLVNLVVKRPTAGPLRDVSLSWRQPGTVQGTVDLSQRFGPAQAFGVRLNVAAEHFDPWVRQARGNRNLLALAADWQLGAADLLEAEFETSHRSQPSRPGFSLLSNRVPAPADPRLNLNNQPWSLPVVLDGDTASLRYTHQLNSAWKLSAHAASQRLTSQDRIAFPYGCGAEDNYSAYCSDGTYDLYDFRSENEHRRNDALELAAHGQFASNLGGRTLNHSASAGVLFNRVRNRFQGQAYNYVGTGNVDGTLFTGADPALTDESTNRDERSTEVFARDALRINEQLTAWAGLRHTRLHRESVRTDGSRPTDYSQSFTTPWLAASFAVSANTLAYASWGQGSESEVAPNRARYANAGEALPALKSRQREVGLKVQQQALRWGAALFDIERPVYADVALAAAGCDADIPGATCSHRVDGVARHRGLEADLQWQQGAWNWQGGLQWLHARREGSTTAAINGQRPTNVPAATLKLQARYDIATTPGLSAAIDLVAESNRMVREDNSLRIPGYARWGTQLRYATRSGTTSLVWRAGIDNLFDRRAWRESPLQFGHTYLFPLPPRTLRLSLEAAL